MHIHLPDGWDSPTERPDTTAPPAPPSHPPEPIRPPGAEDTGALPAPGGSRGDAEPRPTGTEAARALPDAGGTAAAAGGSREDAKARTGPATARSAPDAAGTGTSRPHGRPERAAIHVPGTEGTGALPDAAGGSRGETEPHPPSPEAAHTAPGAAGGAVVADGAGGAAVRVWAGVLVGLGDGLDDGDEEDVALRELAARLPRLVRVAAAGVLLAGEDGELRVVGASCEPARLLAGQGPGPDSFHEGAESAAADLDRGPGGLPPEYARRVLRAGYRAVLALPLRHGKETVGALVLFRAAPGPLDADSAEVARALAGAAALGVLQRRTRRHQARLAAQLQTALDTRVPVEQAKGLLAERFHISVDAAFDLLRTHARAQRLRVADLALALLAGTATVPGPS